MSHVAKRLQIHQRLWFSETDSRLTESAECLHHLHASSKTVTFNECDSFLFLLKISKKPIQREGHCLLRSLTPTGRACTRKWFLLPIPSSCLLLFPQDMRGSQRVLVYHKHVWFRHLPHSLVQGGGVLAFFRKGHWKDMLKNGMTISFHTCSSWPAIGA